MKRRLLFTFVLFMAATVFTWAATKKLAPKPPEIMRLSEVKPGMKGYGKTVFKGTKIEKFDVEVIDVVKNTQPGQDLILVRVGGHGLEFSGVIAGMSGSPIYLEDKVIGALAYAWGFSKEPLAGITPIENMLAELDRPIMPAKNQPEVSYNDFFEEDSKVAYSDGFEFGGRVMKRITTPLMISGFSDLAAQELENELKPYNIIPMIGGDSSADDGEERPILEPGSAVGVQLIRGDMNATAVGTVTYRKGNDIVGFGHPLMGGGQMYMSLVTAKIHTIMPSLRLSFKFASPIEEVGSLVQDRLPCITGKVGMKPADMVPFNVDVVNAVTGKKTSFGVEVAQHTSLTPKLMGMAFHSLMSTAEPSVGESTVDFKLTVKAKGHRPAVLENTFFNPVGPVNKGMMVPLTRLIFNPFELVELESVSIDASVRHDITLARIDSIYFDQSSARPGETVKLHVVLKPFGSEPTEEVFDISVPKDYDEPKLMVGVGGGNSIRPDSAIPDSFDDLIEFYEATYKSTDLVLFQPLQTVGIRTSGKKLDNLPGSAIRLLRPPNVTGSMVAKDILFRVKPTKWVILGRQQAFLNIMQ